MAVTLGTWVNGSSGSPITVALTNPADSGDRMFECRLMLEVRGTEPTGITVTYGGVAATLVTGSPQMNSTNIGRVYSYYILDANLPAVGSQNVVVTLTGGADYSGGVAATVHTGVNQAAPTRVGNFNDFGPTVTIPSAGTFSVLNGGAAVLGSMASDGAATFTFTAGWDERVDAADSTSDSRYAIADNTYAADGTDSVTQTLSADSRQVGEVLVWAPVAAPAGPTIDTQPVADTGLINGDAARRTTVYTVEASSVAVGGVTGIVWNEDATPISDGGVYDIQTTGLGTASASSTLTITRTVKTGTPFVIDADVTDADGTTASDAVNDTWYTGPVISKTSGTTNASGVDTLTITSDYPNADGEFTVITATAGGVTKQVALHYETPP